MEIRVWGFLEIRVWGFRIWRLGFGDFEAWCCYGIKGFVDGLCLGFEDVEKIRIQGRYDLFKVFEFVYQVFVWGLGL